jgi:hypothetical protein
MDGELNVETRSPSASVNNHHVDTVSVAVGGSFAGDIANADIDINGEPLDDEIELPNAVEAMDIEAENDVDAVDIETLNDVDVASIEAANERRRRFAEWTRRVARARKNRKDDAAAAAIVKSEQEKERATKSAEAYEKWQATKTTAAAVVTAAARVTATNKRVGFFFGVN